MRLERLSVERRVMRSGVMMGEERRRKGFERVMWARAWRRRRVRSRPTEVLLAEFSLVSLLGKV